MAKKRTHKDLEKLISKQRLFRNSLEFVKDKKHFSVKQLSGSLKPAFAASLWNKIASPMLVITATNEEAEEWYNDLSLVAGRENIALLTEPKKHVRFPGDLENRLAWLIEGLSKMTSRERPLIIATPQVFDVDLPATEKVISNKIRVKVGDSKNFEEFSKSLILQGYNRQDYVAKAGDIAIRGGIIDIFPVGYDNPLRIEFWGNDIDSIREFSPVSQRSIHDMPEAEFLGNIHLDSEDEDTQKLFDYITNDTLLVIDSPEKIRQHAEIDIDKNRFSTLTINGLGKADISVKSEPQPGFRASVKEFTKEINEMISRRASIFISAEGKIHLDRFREIIESQLEEMNTNANDISASITWLDETFTNGFILPEENIAYFTEHQVFDRIRTQSRRRTNGEKGITLKELRQLKIGDYVVHEDKGIGVFAGFETVQMGGSGQDCVRIKYDGGDMLYVHLNYLNKVQQYVSSEGVVPKVNKLGSTEWARKKARTKKKLKDIARDLIKLYAKRKTEPGYEFPEDSVWQKEFEASFIYEDTPDQADSTADVKDDMQSETPMDRLVCGDVGFGKTEVAIRAAFKAVQAGKQVAVLVPTTILAQQHFMTFRDRLNRYPVNVDVISRFRKKKAQTEIIENIKKGTIDILIGTHRLLSKDIDFKDLGLLVIDEEQRFGVSAKEKLRKMKVSVDTLTLTATPIPRTLNFSLMGARDLSIIETPPRNRIPVYTEISEWDEGLITSAIRKEIQRGGQVFFVNDKVEDLEKLTMDLQMLMPDVKFAIAHGQMRTSELESVMEKFIQGKYDVLVSTKIVESGLDIPNANTMIINRSHHFGLAELYQLRGRVGRTNMQAYCYLLIPPVTKITNKALKRLQAIEEFTDLGSGFQLAMRDLEIRGAGDLLGPEQSGYINDMGMEMYQKILDESVNELRLEEFSDIFKDSEQPAVKYFKNEDISIELDTDAMFPEGYIRNDTDRFTYYKRLYKAADREELEDIVEEITDRFGKLPKKAKELIFAVKVRIAALYTGFTRVILNGKMLKAEFPPNDDKEYYEKGFPIVTEFISEIEGAKLRQAGRKLFLDVPVESRDRAVEILWRIKKALELAE